MTGVYIRETKAHMTHRRSCEDRGREGSDVATSQGTPGVTRSQKKPKKDPPLEPSEGVWPGWHLGFRPLASRTLRIKKFVILSHHVHSNLLRRPQETHARGH